MMQELELAVRKGVRYKVRGVGGITNEFYIRDWDKSKMAWCKFIIPYS
jgi:hypothetical protein